MGFDGDILQDSDSMKAPLTTMQEKVLAFIKDFIFVMGMPPTRQDIADYFQWKSPNAAQCHLTYLVKKGYIVLHPMKSRAIEVLP